MSDQKLRIFISHASNGDGDSAEALERWCTLLRANGFDPKVDKELKSGRWHPELISWMMTCHAAIILLGTKAVCESPWVACESFLLRARQSMDDQFKIFPVALENIAIQDIESATQLNPARLCELSIFRDNALPDNLLSELNLLRPVELFPEEIQPYIECMRGILNPEQQHALCTSAFERAFEHLHQPFKHNTIHMLRDLFVFLLTQSKLSAILRAIAEFQLISEEKRRLHICVIPLWIASEAASQLKYRIKQTTACSLNTGQDYEAAAYYTARWYLARAIGYPLSEPHNRSQSGPLTPQKVIPITLATSDISDDEVFEDQLEMALRTQLNVPLRADMSVHLQHHVQKGKDPIVVLLPSMLSTRHGYSSLLAGLKSKYPQLTWLHLGQLREPGSAPDWIKSAAPWLEPALNIDDEADAIESFQEALDEPLIPFRRSYDLL